MFVPPDAVRDKAMLVVPPVAVEESPTLVEVPPVWVLEKDPAVVVWPAVPFAPDNPTEKSV